MSNNLKIKTNIKYITNTDFGDVQILKSVFGKKNASVVSSREGIIIKEILKDNYNIQGLHISNEKLFLTLASFPMKKSLPKNIYSKIDLL